MNKKKCIITFGRSWHALAATRCLGRNGVQVITGDTSKLVAARFSKYSIDHFVYPNHMEDPDGFIEAVNRIAAKHTGPDIDLAFLPIHTESLTAIYYQDKLNSFIHTALPNKKAIHITCNKRRLAIYCQEHNIPSPRTLHPRSTEELKKQLDDISYPAFVKPAQGIAGIGITKVSSDEQALNAFNRLMSNVDVGSSDELPIVQEGVAGEEYCATFLFDHGRLITSMVYHNIKEFPENKGMGFIRETVDKPNIIDAGARLLSQLDWHGVAEIDFRLSDNGAPWLIEVNPRFWGGLNQSIESGWEYSYWTYVLAIQGSIGTVSVDKKDVKTWNPALGFLAALHSSPINQSMMDDLSKRYNTFTHNNQKSPNTLFSWIEMLAALRSKGKKTIQTLKELMNLSRGSTNEIFSIEDPLPSIGLLYPLVVYLQHGTLTPELLADYPRNKKG